MLIFNKLAGLLSAQARTDSEGLESQSSIFISLKKKHQKMRGYQLSVENMREYANTDGHTYGIREY